MNCIAIQHYYKVEREITNSEQKTVVDERLMYLYKEKIVTKYREFPIAEVFDLSYKPIGGTGGILYLHTLQGVFSYMISADPAFFIAAYKGLADSFSKE
ncbi:hypothetical protein [Bacillus sp. FJAT-28004]|uniref:hypothetical protein n=1 Tax=Bacillus sp. FJAT-28004 TaxID=1679165 RepID=UPI0006B5572C|nr:hypothetical protein [Bacillus sp. FJAT-28004]